MSNLLNNLPSELKAHVLSFIDQKETYDTLCFVSKNWKQFLYASRPSYYFKNSVPFATFSEILTSLTTSLGDTPIRIKMTYLKENQWEECLTAPKLSFPTVTGLSVVHCDLKDDQMIKLLSYFPNLDFFEYSIYYDPASNKEPTKVTNKTFESLISSHNWEEVPNFRSLSICHSSLSEPSLISTLSRTFSSLQQLSLTHTYFLDNSAWSSLFSSLSHLSFLSLGFSTVEDEGLDGLFENQTLCSSLHDLRFIALHYISNNLFKKFSAFPNLRTLELSLMNKVVNDDIRLIGQLLPNLRRFRSQNYQATGEDGFRHLQNIEELSIPDTDRLTDKAIKEISENLRHLQHLDIQNCTKLTQNSLDSLATCVSLVYLDARFCVGLKNPSIPKKMQQGAEKKEKGKKGGGGEFKLVLKNDDRFAKGDFSSCPCSLSRCRYFERDQFRVLYD